MLLDKGEERECARACVYVYVYLHVYVYVYVLVCAYVYGPVTKEDNERMKPAGMQCQPR